MCDSMERFDFDNISLECLLRRCGHEPVFEKGDSLWYLSPFRDEKRPSFQVRGNVFTDWGTPDVKGGVLDFCSRLWNIPRSNTREIFQRLDDFMGANPIVTSSLRPTESRVEKEKSEKVIASYPLNNPVLMNYLLSRGVDPIIAQKYTSVLVYLSPDRTKKLFGIGFANRSGGYELRSQYTKRSFAPKDISILPSGNCGTKAAVVFEGFMDALSYLSQKMRNRESVNFDCVVLNGIGLARQAIDVLKNYEHVFGLLDNDVPGTTATEQLASALPNFVDSRKWLGAFNDVNEKIVDMLSLSQVIDPPPKESKKLGRGL